MICSRCKTAEIPPDRNDRYCFACRSAYFKAWHQRIYQRKKEREEKVLIQNKLTDPCKT